MADDRVLGALEFIAEQVSKLERDLVTQKTLANTLAQAAGMDPVYHIDSLPAEGGKPMIRPDQFANHSAPSAAARAFLEFRKTAATIDQIFEALQSGGYVFNASAPEAKNGLRIAIGKDGLVARLGNGHYGLKEWYPNLAQRRERRRAAGSITDGADGSEDEEEPEPDA